eukprot:gene8333-9230_t
MSDKIKKDFQHNVVALCSCRPELDGPTSIYFNPKSDNGGSAKRQTAAIRVLSFSIRELLRVGKLVTPVSKCQIWLTLTLSFDIRIQEWKEEAKMENFVHRERFSEGRFWNAFQYFQLGEKDESKSWVLKLYKPKEMQTIVEQLLTKIEAHSHKQVYCTKTDGEPATFEEFLNGQFIKYDNNNGYCAEPTMHLTENENEKELYGKAQTLVDFCNKVTEGKMMLLDIEGSGFSLSDPEIGTPKLYDDDAANNEHELLFCCCNLSVIGINKFAAEHECKNIVKYWICKSFHCKYQFTTEEWVEMEICFFLKSVAFKSGPLYIGILANEFQP